MHSIRIRVIDDRSSMQTMLNTCGKCQHVGYCEPLSEWWCKKWHRSLGYSVFPYKGTFCDVIGQDGDTRMMKVMFDMICGDIK